MDPIGGTMKLGDYVQIAIGGVMLADSLPFYERLGFRKIDSGAAPYPWAQLSDGQNALLLNEDGMKYLGLIYLVRDAAAKVAELEAMGAAFAHQTEADGRLSSAIFLDPNGSAVNLVQHDAGAMPRPDGTPLTRCGKFGEFSIPTASLPASLAFWKPLGFDASENTEPYPWAILSDGMIVLGLHQTQDFTRPTLTYFALDMERRIKELEADGFQTVHLQPDSEGRVVAAVLPTPEDQRIFLFQGEV